MKALLTYYGGKQKMTPHILPLIPKHKLYCEPFFGGGAVFFAKSPSPIEVINDTNGELINFYREVKTNLPKLQKMIRATLHSRDLHRKAHFIYLYPHLFTPTERAWAVFVVAHQSFGAILNSTWMCGVADDSTEKKFANRRATLVADYAKRLEKVQIESRDALEVIKTRDSKDTFFYLDPPYINTAMGHYKGYTEADFKALLNSLSRIKGKFLMSSYPSTLLKKYSRKNKWSIVEIEVNLCVQGAKRNSRRKTECLTMNY